MTVEVSRLELAVLEDLCGESEGEFGRTTMFMADDERPLAIAKRNCGCIDCDFSGSLAVHLGTGAHELIERVGERSRDTYAVSWPIDGGALLFSAEWSAESDQADQTLFAISDTAEVSQIAPNGIVTLMHSPATVRAR